MLFLLVAIICLFDPEEILVTIFGIEEETPSDNRGFSDAIHHHIATYYSAAVLLFLFVIGVVNVFTAVFQLCSGRSPLESVRPHCTCRCSALPSSPYCCYFGADCCNGCTQCCTEGGVCCGDGCCTCCGNAIEACPAFANCGEMGSCLAGSVVFLVMLLVVAGLIFVLVALVVWVQRTLERYLQLQELRQLTDEYEVRDLSSARDEVSEMGPPQAEGASTNRGASAPHQEEMGAFPVSFFAPGQSDSEVLQRSLRQDLQAIYGLGESGLEERLRPGGGDGALQEQHGARELALLP